jgi:hypothetical protein
MLTQSNPIVDKAYLIPWSLLFLALLLLIVAMTRFVLGRIIARAVAHLREQDQRQVTEEREGLRSSLQDLLKRLYKLQFVDESQPDLCNDALLLFNREKVTLIVALEMLAQALSTNDFAALLAGFTKAVKDLEGVEGQVKSALHSEQWLDGRGANALMTSVCPVALGHILVFQEEALEQWMDWIRFTFFSKKQFLLHRLQQCIVEEGIYTAIAKRKLAQSAAADVTGEFRKVLILWATSAAIRLVLRRKRICRIEHLTPYEMMPMLDDIFISMQINSFEEKLQKRITQLSATLQDACNQTNGS